MDHHYVPQFLLRGWAESSNDGRVEVFRLDLNHVPSSRKSPKSTGYEPDLYALSRDVVAGMDKQAIEKQFLRHVDNQGALVLQKLLDSGLHSLTSDDRICWARFLMSLRIRQPEIVRMLRDEAAHHLRDALSKQPEQYEELVELKDPPTLIDWTEKHYPGLIENVGLSFFHELVDNPTVGQKILQMRWWLWDFSNAPYELLLADHPCIFTAGIDDASLVICVPISPKKAFMTTQSQGVVDLMRQQQPKELAKRINEFSLTQARVRVYARDDSPARFIRNRRCRTK